MKRVADLHIHTNFSDGSGAPEEVVCEAEALGLEIIAITDHDTAHGVARAQAAASSCGLRTIPGVELSAYFEGQEVHIVGLFIEPQVPTLRKELRRLVATRRERIYKIAAKLASVNISLDPDEITTSVYAPTRLNVAERLCQLGHASSIAAAFARFLKEGSPAYVPKPLLTIPQAVSLIRQAKGVSILAHPEEWVSQEVVARLALLGLDGIEVYSPGVVPLRQERRAAWAKKYGLIMSGGSDYHGDKKPESALGSVRLTAQEVKALEDGRR